MTDSPDRIRQTLLRVQRTLRLRSSTFRRRLVFAGVLAVLLVGYGRVKVGMGSTQALPQAGGTGSGAANQEPDTIVLYGPKRFAIDRGKAQLHVERFLAKPEPASGI